ncbi:transcriptional regulator, TetR family [Roseateles sp. YR242]|uniref:TetR/AcrR family transcriptional regulator n=1 Tax=Roseateles sp. YR242 TaxID=1855305 RepID=UPI0008C9AE9C|nr:TetR/AcrR family transcriptional regulator [Roseateles sp. YR242]SEL65511.1 transcriptional regulator, TetR family [Roseateles sp. YR242]
MRTKTEERRLLILDEAAVVFQDVGYEKASMAEISQRVGGSKATLYNYFPSKEDLFVAVMEHKAKRHMAGIFELLNHEAPLADVLLRFSREFVRVRLSPELVSIHRMAEHEGDRTEVGQLLYRNGIQRGWTLVADFLAECMRRGTLPQADAGVAAWHLKALVEAEVREPRMLGVMKEMPPDEVLSTVVARAVKVWLRGYGAAAEA